MNIIEKKLARKANLDTVIPGEKIALEPSWLIILADEVAHVMNSFKELDFNKILYPSRIVVVGNKSMQKEWKELARHFCEVDEWSYLDDGDQFFEQFMADKIQTASEMVIVGGDSYIGGFGAYGAISLLASPPSIAHCLFTGKIHAVIPDSIYIELNGNLKKSSCSESLCCYLREYFNDSLVGCGVILGGTLLNQLDDSCKKSLVAFLYEMGTAVCLISAQGPMGQVESVIRVNAYDIEGQEKQLFS